MTKESFMELLGNQNRFRMIRIPIHDSVEHQLRIKTLNSPITASFIGV